MRDYLLYFCYVYTVMKHIFTKHFLRHWVSVPFIWFMILPVIVLHIGIEIYQQICFRLYGLELVKINNYISVDRNRLSYLSLLDIVNCGYCTYVNGVFAYASEIGHKTEYYWCAIKHANQPTNPAFAYQAKYADYGDKDSFEQIRSTRGKK